MCVLMALQEGKDTSNKRVCKVFFLDSFTVLEHCKLSEKDTLL